MGIRSTFHTILDSTTQIVVAVTGGLVSYANAFQKTGDMVNVTLDNMIEEQQLEIAEIKSKRAALIEQSK